jgi:hypothetical protein
VYLPSYAAMYYIQHSLYKCLSESHPPIAMVVIVTCSCVLCYVRALGEEIVFIFTENTITYISYYVNVPLDIILRAENSEVSTFDYEFLSFLFLWAIPRHDFSNFCHNVT